MGVSNAPGGVVDANRLLLLKDGGGPSGGVGCRGAGDVAEPRRTTTSSQGDLLHPWEEAGS